MASKSIAGVFATKNNIFQYFCGHCFSPLRASSTLVHCDKLRQTTFIPNVSPQYPLLKPQSFVTFGGDRSSHIRRPSSFLTVIPKLTRCLNTSSRSQYKAAQKSVVDVEQLLGDVDRIDHIDKLFHDLVSGTRMALARAITLVEASHPGKQRQAQYLLTKVLQHNQDIERHNFKGPQTFRIGTFIFTLDSVLLHLFALF